jgi:hypothetical protein
VKFEVEHHFRSSPEEVAAALLDESFQATLKDVGRLADRVVLSQEDKDGLIVRRTRCVLHLETSGVAKRFIGNADPAWVEVAEWHPEEMKWTWVVEPEVAAELLEAHGHTELEAYGGGTIRRVIGHVKVRVPIYGGKVEGWIAEGLEEAYAEEAELLEKWLVTGP